jgi:hypothetical protein
MADTHARHRLRSQVLVDLPEELLLLFGPTPTKAAVCLKKLALVELFRRGEVSSGYAASVLGTSKGEFIALLAAHDVPYIDVSEEELRQQFEAAKPRKVRAATPPSATQVP